MKKLINKIFNRLGYVKREELSDLEKSFSSSLKLMEHKFWENNNNINTILYELELSKGKKKENFSPKISIIIPVYNGSKYLKYAIDCALKQTYTNVEIIVVNDGSNDGKKSASVAKKYGKKIKYYEKENGGVSSALNYGIKKMTGEYFAWLSHDDMIEPDHIEKLVEYISIEGNEKKIPYASFKIIDEYGNIRLEDTIIAQTNCFDYKTSLMQNEFTLLKGEINGGSVLIPKEAFKKHGMFDEKQRITQERDMWSRLMTEYKFISIPYVTAMIRTHSNQVTNTNPNIKIESDKKNIEIISSISNERIKKMGLSKNEFYEILKLHHKDNNNREIYKAIEELQKSGGKHE